MIASRSAAEIAACSRALLDRPLSGSGALYVCTCSDAADTRGAWSSAKGFARGGGGGGIALGPGSVYVALILERASAIVADADPERIVNRYVRPMLGALTKMGVPSMYGGRDFVQSRKSPIAWVGFQHSAETGRAAFEAIVGVETPIAPEPRHSFMDRAPKSLRELGCVHDASVVAERIESACRTAFENLSIEAFADELDVANGGDGSRRGLEGDEVPAESAFEVKVAVGVVGARRRSGAIGVYGDFYASREVVPRIDAGLLAGMEIDACLEAALSNAVLVGLPSTEPLSRVIADVRR